MQLTRLWTAGEVTERSDPAGNAMYDAIEHVVQAFRGVAEAADPGHGAGQLRHPSV